MTADKAKLQRLLVKLRINTGILQAAVGQVRRTKADIWSKKVEPIRESLGVQLLAEREQLLLGVVEARLALFGCLQTS